LAIRKIAQLGEPVLRRVAAEVRPEELATARVQTLIDDLIETMHDADGAGLAAPQVYESLRITVIEVKDNPRYPGVGPIPLTVLVNPVLSRAPLDGDDSAIEMFEGCLSITGVRGRVRRPRRVEVTALGRNGEPLSFTWEGFNAAVVQHETDHLDGVLFVDRADPRSLTFLREFERHVPFEDRVVDAGVSLLSPSRRGAR
jgi:peptide deformylase